MTAPIASPHPELQAAPEPQVVPVHNRGTVAQWLYAMVCVGLCALILFSVVDTTQSFIRGLFVRDCGTGLTRSADVLGTMLLWSIPLIQFLCVRSLPWGTGPLRLMRGALFVSGMAAAGLFAMLAFLPAISR